jgi:hypothetical protein
MRETYSLKDVSSSPAKKRWEVEEEEGEGRTTEGQ